MTNAAPAVENVRGMVSARELMRQKEDPYKSLELADPQFSETR